jgi:hypothetical protein
LLTINAFWLGANIGSGILTPVLVPFLVAIQLFKGRELI